VFYAPTRVEDACDLCGGELYTRTDDTWATARHRLDVYETQTRPLVRFFAERGLAHEVDALGEVDEVAERIEKVVLHAHGAAGAVGTSPQHAVSTAQLGTAQLSSAQLSTARLSTASDAAPRP
jgi:hypothetical protein